MTNFQYLQMMTFVFVIAETEINRLEHTVFKTVQKVTETNYILKCFLSSPPMTNVLSVCDTLKADFTFCWFI